MFTEKTITFISKEMSIDIPSLEEKINDIKDTKYRSICIESVEQFTNIILGNPELVGKTLGLYQHNQLYEDILEFYKKVIPSTETSFQEDILGVIQHAFCSYAEGGLLELYLRQQNEDWYPRIVISEVLLPNDIDTLSNQITIYRGANIREFSIKTYGQSWTEDKQSAMRFAYCFYSDKPWYEEQDRCVLQASINREDIFYYSKSNPEKEVIVNPEKLKSVELTDVNKN